MNTQQFIYSQWFNVKHKIDIRKGQKVPVFNVVLLKHIGVPDSLAFLQSSEKEGILPIC